jgi:hypothetical protein
MEPVGYAAAEREMLKDGHGRGKERSQENAITLAPVLPIVAEAHPDHFTGGNGVNGEDVDRDLPRLKKQGNRHAQDEYATWQRNPGLIL